MPSYPFVSSLKPRNRATLDSLMCSLESGDREVADGVLPAKKGPRLANGPGALERGEAAKLGMACAFKAVLGFPGVGCGLSHPKWTPLRRRTGGTGGCSRDPQTRPSESRGLGGDCKQLTTGSFHQVKGSEKGSCRESRRLHSNSDKVIVLNQRHPEGTRLTPSHKTFLQVCLLVLLL